MGTPGLLALVQLLTFNIWGLPDAGFLVLSPLRGARVAAICERLSRGHWDVVMLQEVWRAEDRATLKRCGYPHAVDLEDPSRKLDSGLLVLSKHPLERPAREIYSARPDSSRVMEDGEALARKSALVVRVMHPTLGPFWVANTHLVSTYVIGSGVDVYAETRLQQFRDFVDFAREKAGTEPLILGGDFNFGPGTAQWPELAVVVPGASQAPGAEAACTVCPPNFMHAENEGKLDHLVGTSGVTAVSGAPAMLEPLMIDGEALNFSDHFGWESSFRL